MTKVQEHEMEEKQSDSTTKKIIKMVNIKNLKKNLTCKKTNLILFQR